jgi:hypothetical protein
LETSNTARATGSPPGHVMSAVLHETGRFLCEGFYVTLTSPIEVVTADAIVRPAASRVSSQHKYDPLAVNFDFQFNELSTERWCDAAISCWRAHAGCCEFRKPAAG